MSLIKTGAGNHDFLPILFFVSETVAFFAQVR